MSTREDQIASLYREILNREADVEGLNNYAGSNLTIDQIRECLSSSTEALGLIKKPEASVSSQSPTRGDSLLIMGASPKIDDHINKLKQENIEAVLCLDNDSWYDTSWLKSSLHVPIKDSEPISEELLTKCIDFIYNNVVVKHRKTFVHSDKGVSRAPMMLALFIFVEKKVNLLTALASIMKHRPGIEPSRDLVNSDVLECAVSLRSKYANSINMGNKVSAPSEFVSNLVTRISDKVMIGNNLDNDVVDTLVEEGVKTVLELNPKRSEVSGQHKCRFIHVPVKGEDIKDLMSVIVKNITKFIKKGKMYVYSSDADVLNALIDEYTKK